MDHSDYFAGYENDKPIVSLEDWSVIPIFSTSPFLAPEVWKHSLYGKCFNHPLMDDGDYVHTTIPIDVCGLAVETKNTIYVLGKMNLKYAEWCDKNGFIIDPENPFGESL